MSHIDAWKDGRTVRKYLDGISGAIPRAFDDTMIDCLHAYQRSLNPGMSRDEVASEYVHRPDRKENILASVED